VLRRENSGVFWRDLRRFEIPSIHVSFTSSVIPQQINSLSFEATYIEFQKCCGARQWVAQMADRRPFRSREDLLTTADTIWQALEPSVWKDTFGHHPKIGDLDALKKKFASTAQ
jgi:hypothetical protein